MDLHTRLGAFREPPVSYVAHSICLFFKFVWLCFACSCKRVPRRNAKKCLNPEGLW